MQGYSGFKKKKSTLGSTITIVALLHVAVAAGLVWLASTSVGREMLAVYKINVLNLPPPKPEPPSPAPEVKPPAPETPPTPEAPAAEKAPEPEPEPPPAPEMEAEAPPPEASAPSEVASSEASGNEPAGSGVEAPAESGSQLAATEAPSGPIRLPGSGNPFSGGKGGVGKKYSGYTDLVTSEIQKHYKQPADLPTDLRLAVLFQLRLDGEGKLLEFKLVNSSGNPLFDESALKAISNIKQLRPPPQGMSKTLTVKFFPPTG